MPEIWSGVSTASLKLATMSEGLYFVLVFVQDYFLSLLEMDWENNPFLFLGNSLRWNELNSRRFQ